MNTSIEIRRLTSDSDKKLFWEIAQIHQEEITEGFLSTLGTRFLKRLYGFVVASPQAFILAAISEGQVVGFICGSINTESLCKEIIIKHGWQMFPILLPKIFSLKTILRIKETLFYSQKNEFLELPKSEILNFCVRGKYQRKGIATRLFQQFIKELQRLKIDKIKIITGEQQISAQRFYDKMNAKKIANVVVHNGTISYVYIYNI